MQAVEPEWRHIGDVWTPWWGHAFENVRSGKKHPTESITHGRLICAMGKRRRDFMPLQQYPSCGLMTLPLHSTSPRATFAPYKNSSEQPHAPKYFSHREWRPTKSWKILSGREKRVLCSRVLLLSRRRDDSVTESRAARDQKTSDMPPN